MNKILGYARVSTNDQELDLQVNALKKMGILQDHIFVDKTSGAKTVRPGLDKCLESLEEGDTLVVWRLDRLGRSMKHLIFLIEDLKSKNIGFKSICDGVIDTTSASGELVFNIFSALSQFEQRLLQERTRAGLKAARARGKLGGRKSINANDPRVKMAKKMSLDTTINISEICNMLNISKATYYRFLKIS